MSSSPIAKKQKLRTHATPKIPITVEINDVLDAETMHPDTVPKLRDLVKSCQATSQHRSAVFYAGKLASMTRDPIDRMLLARSYYLTGDYHQAIHTLQGLVGQLDAGSPRSKTEKPISPARKTLSFSDTSVLHATWEYDEEVVLRAYLLLGQSMVGVKQWEDCQEMLEGVLSDDEGGILHKAASLNFHETVQINVVASLCCLRGEVCEALESRERAAYWYRLALQCDAHCADAFTNLAEKHMLTPEQERRMFESLHFRHPHDDYLKALYAAQLGRYDQFPTIQEKFQPVEEVFGLSENVDVVVAKAEASFYQHNTDKAYQLCKWVRERDPYNYKCIPVYVATLVQLERKSELFHFAHQMVDMYPKKAAAWYTVGCYYVLVKKFDTAQRFFHKATNIEPHFAPAWIGFGNAFAAQDESDQAMSSYRTATRLFLGCHFPLLCIGMEHYRTNNLALAAHFVSQACDMCPFDPLVYNELGTICFRQQNYQGAVDNFSKAITLCQHLSQTLLVPWEATYFNLGQSYRKLKQYGRAIHNYHLALDLCPRKASTHFALGFTYHLQGRLHDAIQCYHLALSYDPEDPVAIQTLDDALKDMFANTDLNAPDAVEEEAKCPVSRSNISVSMDISTESMDL
ncbi:cell division cycle protein 16 [Achlya hypogyna]|uniref:Cell division cycle protein 16 n=1 Tax=Achlya hypogyna TaxID=1202772 RepID=A0A1V9Y5D3_ACHHY|nr:cell division cycle protein 16 [Achlya hypogyna]